MLVVIITALIETLPVVLLKYICLTAFLVLSLGPTEETMAQMTSSHHDTGLFPKLANAAGFSKAAQPCFYYLPFE